MGNSSHASYAAPPQAVGPSGPSGSYSAGAASFQRPGNEAQVQTIYNQFLSIYYVSTCLGLTFQYGRLVAVEIFDQSKHVLIFWSWIEFFKSYHKSQALKYICGSCAAHTWCGVGSSAASIAVDTRAAEFVATRAAAAGDWTPENACSW